MTRNNTLECDNMIKSEDQRSTWRTVQQSFYSSQAWKNLRDAVIKERGGLCEMCRRSGIYKAADLVHHIIPVTAENINDPDITLNPRNLMALCKGCHSAIHSSKRYVVDEAGHVVII